MNRLKIAFLAGGDSSEREIALQSAAQIEAALDPGKYDVTVIDVRGRDWHYTAPDGRRWQLDRNDFSLTVDELHRLALAAYKACRCRGIVRVDFIVTPEGRPYLIEINTIPGMSAGSIVPKQVRAAGMTLGELYDLIIADTCGRKP